MAGWFGHKQPVVWSQTTGSLVTNDRKFGHKQYGVIYDLPFINPSLQAGVQTHANSGFSPDGTQHGILHISFIHLSEKMCINLWALPWAVVLRPFGAVLLIRLD